MKFLHLSAADHGGAGIAAWRIHDGLRSLGHSSSMLVLDRRSDDADVLALGRKASAFRLKRILQKLWLKLSSRPNFYFQNQLLSPKLNKDVLLSLASLKPDVIIVHFISHFLEPGDVRTLQQFTNAPVLWHLVDMGHLTGGCHYAWRCEGYFSSCGDCPALRWRGISYLSSHIWREKYLEIGATRGWVVAGSSLLGRQAAASSLFRARHIETLLLGVSPQKFIPGNVLVLRKNFGIENAEKVIFFGAQKFNQSRKGMHLLFDALSLLADDWPYDSPLPVLLAAGNAMNFSALRKKGFTLVDLGFVDVDTLAKAYAAADLFACPSIEDSGPMMINESMMSGTPVVSFRMGVAEDLIEDGITGAIAELGNVVEFTEGMRRILLWDMDQHAFARQRCRNLAIEKCSNEYQLENFVKVAEELVKTEGVGSIC